jgi:hypothetical protein
MSISQVICKPVAEVSGKKPNKFVAYACSTSAKSSFTGSLDSFKSFLTVGFFFELFHFILSKAILVHDVLPSASISVSASAAG